MKQHKKESPPRAPCQPSWILCPKHCPLLRLRHPQRPQRLSRQSLLPLRHRLLCPWFNPNRNLHNPRQQCPSPPNLPCKNRCPTGCNSLHKKRSRVRPISPPRLPTSRQPPRAPQYLSKHLQKLPSGVPANPSRNDCRKAFPKPRSRPRSNSLLCRRPRNRPPTTRRLAPFTLKASRRRISRRHPARTPSVTARLALPCDRSWRA